MDEAVSRVLRGGVLLSTVLVLLGLALMTITGDASCPFGVLDLQWLIWGESLFAPAHVLFLGFMILIATPVLNVFALFLMFLRAHDAPFTAITALVLLILIVSFMLGVG
jgi:uncharacterized membrane protein